MERALQRRLKMDDAEFEKFLAEYGPFEFKGSIALVWNYNRPWHWKTKQEIFNLLLVTHQLDVSLPRLVIELIACFIQQQELFQDLDADTIQIKLVWSRHLFFSKHQRETLWEIVQRPGLSIHDTTYDASDEAFFVPIVVQKFWPRWREWCQELVTKWDRYRIVSPFRDRFAKLLDP